MYVPETERKKLSYRSPEKSMRFSHISRKYTDLMDFLQ
jgi:hypothetical protein